MSTHVYIYICIYVYVRITVVYLHGYVDKIDMIDYICRRTHTYIYIQTYIHTHTCLPVHIHCFYIDMDSYSRVHVLVI